MNTVTNLLIAAAMSGALAAVPVTASASDTRGGDNVEKLGCNGKNGCKGKSGKDDKESCKSKGKKDKDKSDCSGKDGCSGKEGK